MNPVFLPEIPEQEKRAISLLRVIAIFSVITAHVNTVVTENDTMRWIITCIWDAFGQIGVVCFFILGGFLYHREANDGKTFARKKVESLVRPWLIAASLTYAISCVLNNHVDPISALKWIAGFGTWYYYISVFLFFLFLFNFLWQREWLLYLCMGLTACSIAMYTFFPGGTKYIPVPPYLNVFNWIGFFSLGILTRRNRWNTRLKSVGVFGTALIVASMSLVLMFALGGFGYFHLLAIPWEIGTTIVLWYLARSAAERKWTNLLISIGNDTYCIYLFHVQIVQFVTKRIPAGVVSDVVKPIIGLVLMMAIVFLAKKLLCMLPYGQALCRAVGMRI